MRNRVIRSVTVLIPVSSLALALSGCNSAEPAAAASTPAVAEHRVDVPALTVGTTDLESTLQISGNLVPQTRVAILATTDRGDTARRLALYWGVTPVCTDIGENADAAGTLIAQQLVARGLVRAGSSVVLVSIHPDLTRTDANYLKIQQL